MAETSAPNPIRRKVLKGLGYGAAYAVGAAVGYRVTETPTSTPTPENPPILLTLHPNDFGFDDSKANELQVVYVSKENDFNELEEMKRDWRRERLLNKQADALANIWTRHWMTANNLFTGDKVKDADRFEVNKKLIIIQTKDMINYFTEAKMLLEASLVKSKLTGIAQFRDFGDKGSPLFSSPFFGEQEFKNIKATTITRINLGIHAVIGMIEYTHLCDLYGRLSGKYGQGIYDPVNSHVGWNAARSLTGQTDGNVEELGLDTRGGVLANNKMAHSSDLKDRLVVLLQPFILNFRATNYPENVGTTEKPKWIYKVNALEITDKIGNVTPIGKNILLRYNSTDTWQRRFAGMYAGLQEFCEIYPGFKGILTESIV